MAMAMELLSKASPQTQVGNVGVVCEDCGVWSLDGMHGLSLIFADFESISLLRWAGLEVDVFWSSLSVGDADDRGEISVLQKLCKLVYRRTTFSVVASESPSTSTGGYR